MTITLPGHSFPYWSDPGEHHSPPALVIGAGFSTPQVRLPYQLTVHYAEQQNAIEKALCIATSFNFKLNENGKANDPDDLYCWAERCVNELIKKPGATADTAKRRFISAIGLLEDQQFAATANIPLRGTTPRHRVLARFAREGCIYSLWSLNWDLWLEAAFEAVGLVRKNSTSTNFSDELQRVGRRTIGYFFLRTLRTKTTTASHCTSRMGALVRSLRRPTTHSK